MRIRRRIVLGLLALLGVGNLGHLNSPHIFLEETIGSYRALVIVHMPLAVPGEAELQVRLQNHEPEEEVQVLVREIPPQGEDQAPDWVRAEPSQADPSFFTTPIPLMVVGLWHAEVRVQGPRGEGTIKIPISARVPVPRGMTWLKSLLLVSMILTLIVTLFQIMIGLGRDAHRAEAVPSQPSDRTKGRLWAVAGMVGFAAFLFFIGIAWRDFNALAERLSARSMECELTVRNSPALAGKRLSVDMEVRGRDGKRIDEVAPDHGKMMHLIVVHHPDASYFLHVHPRMISKGRFSFEFIPPEEGTYKFFADVLFTTGEGETVTATLDVGPGPEVRNYTFGDADDSHSFQVVLGGGQENNLTWDVGDGLSMRWKRQDAGPLEQGEFNKLEFELVRAGGEPVTRIEPYMGMAGHLLVLREDFETFAHVHPMGTISGRMEMPAAMDVASFPFGFPRDGLYRLWVQMKNEGRVYTGVFDVRVR